MDSSDWSHGIRYHTFGTRPDTEFNLSPFGDRTTRRIPQKVLTLTRKVGECEGLHPVHISTQLESLCTLKQGDFTQHTPPKVLTSCQTVNECKPLVGGLAAQPDQPHPRPHARRVGVRRCRLYR